MKKESHFFTNLFLAVFFMLSYERITTMLWRSDDCFAVLNTCNRWIIILLLYYECGQYQVLRKTSQQAK